MRICEHFRSLQGEGLTIGAPTLFIRTVGCNLRCEWCDTTYSYDGGEEMTVDQVLSLLDDTPIVCITGGEPLMQDDMPLLIDRILSTGKKVVLETNGSMDISCLPKNKDLIISMDIKCPSSKMQDKMNFRNLEYLSDKDQLKFVIGGSDDLEFAESILREYNVDTNVIFSPVGGMNLQFLADHVVANRLNVRVLPQLHKIIWGDRTGV